MLYRSEKRSADREIEKIMLHSDFRSIRRAQFLRLPKVLSVFMYEDGQIDKVNYILEMKKPKSMKVILEELNNVFKLPRPRTGDPPSHFSLKDLNGRAMRSAEDLYLNGANTFLFSRSTKSDNQDVSERTARLHLPTLAPSSSIYHIHQREPLTARRSSLRSRVLSPASAKQRSSLIKENTSKQMNWVYGQSNLSFYSMPNQEFGAKPNMGREAVSRSHRNKRRVSRSLSVGTRQNTSPDNLGGKTSAATEKPTFSHQPSPYDNQAVLPNGAANDQTPVESMSVGQNHEEDAYPMLGSASNLETLSPLHLPTEDDPLPELESLYIRKYQQPELHLEEHETIRHKIESPRIDGISPDHWRLGHPISQTSPAEGSHQNVIHGKEEKVRKIEPGFRRDSAIPGWYVANEITPLMPENPNKAITERNEKLHSGPVVKGHKEWEPPRKAVAVARTKEAKPTEGGPQQSDSETRSLVSTHESDRGTPGTWVSPRKTPQHRPPELNRSKKVEAIPPEALPRGLDGREDSGVGTEQMDRSVSSGTEVELRITNSSLESSQTEDENKSSVMEVFRSSSLPPKPPSAQTYILSRSQQL